MTAAALRAHLRPRIEKLVDGLVEMIAERVERQIEDALEAARSALESDLAVGHETVRDTIEMPLVGPVGRVVHRGVKPSSDDVSSRRAGPGEAPAGVPAHLDRAPSSDPSPRRARGERTNTCRKCGAVGFTARTCGKTHNVSPAPTPVPAPGRSKRDLDVEVRPAASAPSVLDVEDDDLDDEKTESPPLVARADRFAAIEASARKRTGELPVPRSTYRL